MERTGRKSLSQLPHTLSSYYSNSLEVVAVEPLVPGPGRELVDFRAEKKSFAGSMNCFNTMMDMKSSPLQPIIRLF